MDGSTIKVPAAETHLVECKKGDLVVFRQDMVHQGCGYKKTNLRYFMYLDLLGN